VTSGLVLAAGGVAGVLAAPLAGALSDRTTGPSGRRRPWAVGGSAAAALSLVALAFAGDAGAVAVAWIGVCVGTAVASAALTAMIADQLEAQRGAASAVVSSAQALGIVVGVGAVVVLGLGVQGGYLLMAAVVAVLGVGGVILLPDPPAPAATAAARRRLCERRAGVRDRDLAWLLAGRLVVNVGNALGTSLLLFFLMHGLGREAVVAQDDLLLLIVVYTVFVVGSAVLAGRVSDRSGRRMGWVVGSALVQAAAALLLALAPSLAAAMIAAALLGTGYGAYMAVGLALATDVLPGRADHARDLGLVTVAASLGQLLGPLLGAGLVALTGRFGPMFGVASALSVAGGLMTLALRPGRTSRSHTSRP
jgi:MFS family permease